ncbi:MAG: hypothetical protein ABI266_04590 [Ginsengibacter sp.]
MDFSILWKKYLFICSFFFLSFGAFAQQNHFIYLQTENTQLFYVKVNAKVISSSSAGYLILPDLPNGTFQLTIGFPKNEFPEERFDINVVDKNEGYLIKNMPGRGWVLFNLQSLALIDKTSEVSPVAVAKTVKSEDAFSTLLSNAVNDSSLFQHDTVENKIENQSAIAGQVLKDSTLPKVDSNIKAIQSNDVNLVTINNGNEINDTVSNKILSDTLLTINKIKADTLRISDTVFVKSKDEVNKILGVKESTGMDMIYTVKKPAGEDTVRIFLPATDLSKTSQTDTLNSFNNNIQKSKDASLTITPTIIPPDYKAAEHTASNDSIMRSSEIPAVVKMDSSQEIKEPIIPFRDKKVDEHVHDSITGVAKSEGEIIVLPQTVSSSEVNSDCSSFATDQDFLKVRKKMAATTGRENMIEAARKFFKLKCYSTAQIKNLSFLFLSEEGKYLFFDMAYEYTSDSNLYETLQSQFQDPYYLNRFKAMIRK